MILPTKFPEHLKNHLYSAFYGSAIGDALGFLVELKSPQEIFNFAHKLYQDKENTINWLNQLHAEDWVTHKIYPSGQVSDDTQLTLLLIEALSEGGEKDFREIFRQKLAHAFSLDKIYSYGYTTKNVAQIYLKNSQISQGNTTSTSNGSVMRIAPIGIYFSNSLELTAKYAYEHSQDTHAHVVPCTASQAQALAMALLIQGYALSSSDDKINFIKKIADYLTDTSAKALYLNLIQMIGMNLTNAKEFILELDTQQSAGMQNGGISMHALTCTIWAHYCFLSSPSDYWLTITNALSIGGDVDTVASIAGSLSGVHNTTTSFPSWATEWLKFE